jgi:hypothetical protein
MSEIITSESISSSSCCNDDNDDEEEESEDEEQLVPPPSSWFEKSTASLPDPDTNDNVPTSSTTNMHPLESDLPPTKAVVFQQDDFAETATVNETVGAAAVVGARVRIPITTPPSYCAPTPTTQSAVGNTYPSPSWKEISSQVLPAAARELLSSSLRRIYYTARLSYAKSQWHRKYSDIGNNAGGFALSEDLQLPPSLLADLPPFSSLPWVDRQMVKEWRTYFLPDDAADANAKKANAHANEHVEEQEDTLLEKEDFDFERARTLVPSVLPRPKWQKAENCHQCHQPFGPTRLRHHCRLCGNSFCQSHSSASHNLPHLGYDPEVPERVCDTCRLVLLEQNLAERVAWRLARCRDYMSDDLTPYFETGLDSYEQVALRVTKAALAMAKSIPLGAQATVAVETVDVLRKYGLNGIYGIMLRQEFLAAADLLRQALGINKTSWPLSVHELSAAIFYALAQHRAMRGLGPEREHLIHGYRDRDRSGGPRDSSSSMILKAPLTYTSYTTSNTTSTTDREAATTSTTATDKDIHDNYELSALSSYGNAIVDQTDVYNPNLIVESEANVLETCFSPPENRKLMLDKEQEHDEQPNFTPVCDPVHDHVISSLLFYAPIALTFIYATKEVDMQLLAAQQGWRLLYAFLEQDKGEHGRISDRPASAVFVHHEYKIVCLSVRGTATINDVITDIRQIPVPFPDNDQEPPTSTSSGDNEEDWTNVFRAQGIALCGMAAAAVNLYREHIDSLMLLAKQGYRIRITGHSLGGGVATLIGVLVLRHLKRDSELGAAAQHATTTLEEKDILRVYAYGTPSCVDAKLANSVNSFVTTVVLHDDVFPRLTPTSVRGLLKHLLHIRETWVKTHLEHDLLAIGERAKTAWAPRFRQSFSLTTPSRSIKRYCRKKIQNGRRRLLSVKGNLVGDGAQAEGSDDADNNKGHIENVDQTMTEGELVDSDPNHWGEKFFIPASQRSSVESDQASGEIDADTEEHPPQFLLEFLGGVDNRAQGMVIDGDEFFDTEEKLLESDEDNSASFVDPISALPDETLSPGDSWSLDLHDVDRVSEQQPFDNSPANDAGSDEGPTAVVLEETPLPRMFVPGKIIHLYSHRGVYKAAYVPRTFRELRRISLAGNMLSDHTTKAYYESLLEVQTARTAVEGPPRWTAFDEDDTW